jgi:hypothetical protein
VAKATVKIDKNGHERTPTEKFKTGRTAPGLLVPISSSERMQPAVFHSLIEITFH